MTDDARHAELLAVLHEIRDSLLDLIVLTRERPITGAPAASSTLPGFTPFAELMDSIAKAGEQAKARAGQALRSAPDTWANAVYDGEIVPPEDDPEGKGYLLAAGMRWQWRPNIQSVDGPYCANRHRLRYQDSAQGAPKAVRDEHQFGPIGWLTCPSCSTSYPVPGLVTVGAIRRAAEGEFRRRLGLGGK